VVAGSNPVTPTTVIKSVLPGALFLFHT